MNFLQRIVSTWKTTKEDPQFRNIQKAQRRKWSRLRMLGKFVKVSERAEEIEKEWQRIQQNEHDALYAFQCTLQEENKQDYFYKKGIADGVKWCLKNFS